MTIYRGVYGLHIQGQTSANILSIGTWNEYHPYTFQCQLNGCLDIWHAWPSICLPSVTETCCTSRGQDWASNVLLLNNSWPTVRFTSPPKNILQAVPQCHREILLLDTPDQFVNHCQKWAINPGLMLCCQADAVEWFFKAF